MSTLILPKHVAERRIKQVEKEKKVKKKPLEKLEEVLDPIKMVEFEPDFDLTEH